ncbi:MAG: aminopeptidase P family protein [Bacteroidales bacterium]|nr:aminopeptidase P family protein [Bacteroidales bacterium]
MASSSTVMKDCDEKLSKLRLAMKQNTVDVAIFPQSDPHIGEYIPDHWKIIRWLTGFSGSAATVIVTHDFAGLWTDSRYYLQAERQLAGSEFILMRPDTPGQSDYPEWLAANVSNGTVIGLDANVFPLVTYRKIAGMLNTRNISFVTDFDPVSSVWVDRPAMPHSAVWDHPLSFAGRDRSVKIAMLRSGMQKTGVVYHFLNSPDDIMWLLNIRAGDLPYSPLSYCYALISDKNLLLFIEAEKLSEDLKAEFAALGIELRPYTEAGNALSEADRDGSLLMSPASTSLSLFNSIPSHLKLIEGQSIPARLKAVKNRTEIENISRTMISDGVALTRFFRMIEEGRGSVEMTELSLSEKLHELRKQQSAYLCPSFQTIVAYNEHAALPHYVPDNDTNVRVAETGILLVDSGGQYMGGTTDITRTIALGTPSLQQKRDFTLVLKGHIALAVAKFPAGTRGYQLDILARKPLWEAGLNYGHGTGHGVGYCLNVHEGPQSISPADNKTAIEEGMLISNEPAIYRTGEYGIRTENLIVCYADEETESGHFLKFDTLSLCHIDKTLIDMSLLDSEETEWINAYHNEVYEKLSPHLNDEECIWLREKTAPL